MPQISDIQFQIAFTSEHVEFRLAALIDLQSLYVQQQNSPQICNCDLSSFQIANCTLLTYLLASCEWFQVVNLCCKGRTADAAIQSTTQTNLTVSAGSAAKFGCERDNGSKIRWNFKSPRDKLPQVLYNGDNVVDRLTSKVSVNATGSWNEITVNNVSVNDSGAYSCHEVEKYSRNVIFYLNVKGWLFSPIVSQSDLCLRELVQKEYLTVFMHEPAPLLCWHRLLLNYLHRHSTKCSCSTLSD